MQQDTRRYLIAAVVLLIGAGATQGARLLRGVEAKYQPDFGAVPLTIGAYQGERVPVDETVFKYLEAQAMEDRIYRGPDRAIMLSLVYGVDWRAIHAPTGCYPAQGWQIVHDRSLEIPAPADCPHPGPLQARMLDATKEGRRELAAYVYARPGGTTSDWTTHAARVSLGPRGAGGMIIIARTPVVNGDVASAERALVELLRAVYAKAVRFWYK